jgi:hypothetical protein
LINDPDKTKAGRVVTEMLIQEKFDLAKLKKAFGGRYPGAPHRWVLGSIYDSC